jgi:hypothetical protein
LVGFCSASGGESVREDEDDPDHACRSGDGTTGALGFAGVRSLATVDSPLAKGAGFEPATEGRGWAAEPLDFGNGKACAVLSGERPGAGDRGGAFELPAIVPEETAPLDTDKELCVSSPTFLRLVSDTRASLVAWLSFNTRRPEEEREGPNAGDEYRFLERVALALPTPSHLYTPLGFLDRVFRGEVVGVCRVGGLKL